MKKLFGVLFVLILLAAAAGAAGLYYIRPDPMLTLDYEPVSLEDKALDMVKRMSLDLKWTEADLNNALKMALAKNPRPSRDVMIRGADFSLSGNLLTADLNLLWKDRVPAGMQVIYRLSWQDPDLMASVEKVQVKGIGLPAEWAEDLTVPLGRSLPQPLKIQDIRFGENELTIVFQKPGLTDLRELVGT